MLKQVQHDDVLYQKLIVVWWLCPKKIKPLLMPWLGDLG